VGEHDQIFLCFYLNVLSVGAAEAATGAGSLPVVLVGGHVDSLVVLPGNKHLVIPVQQVSGAPWDGLLLQLLLVHNGDPVQPVLSHSAGAGNAQLRELIQERERGEKVVEEDLTSG